MPNYFAPAQSDLGRGLQNIAAAMFMGDSPAAQEAKRAKADEDRAQAEYRRAQITELGAKREAAEAARASSAAAPMNFIEALLPGRGQSVMDFRKAGGMVAPQPETADLPGIVGGYEAERPRGYTPEVEGMIGEALASLALQGGLTGKTNFEQFQKGRGEGQKQRIVGNAMSGVDQPIGNIAEAFYATGGKPLYRESQGRVLRQATGALGESGEQAQANIVSTKAQTRERGARARLYGAQAERTLALPTSEPMEPVVDPDTGETVLQPRSGAAGMTPGVRPKVSTPEKPAKPPKEVSEKTWDDTVNSALAIVKKGAKTAPGSAPDLSLSDRTRIKTQAKKIRRDDHVDLGEAVQLAIERLGGVTRGDVPTGEKGFFGNPKKRPGQLLPGMAADGAALPAATPAPAPPGGAMTLDEYLRRKGL
jgi:hypothetical protein